MGVPRFLQSRHCVQVLLFVVLVGASVLAPIPAQATVSGGTEATNSNLHSIAPTSQNNSTVHHEHPDRIDERGDTERLQAWLGSQLAGRLEASSVNLSQGEYDRAREQLDEEYRDLLAKYVEVSGETDEGDDRPTEFETVHQEQAELISATEEYNRTLAQYREAKADGNTARARELARDLERLASQINESSATLRNSTDQIATETGADLSEVNQSVHDVEEDVTSQQADIRESEFIETTLDVRVENETGSFLDPFELTGSLTTQNGTALANRTITLQIGNQTVRTTTNASGRFTVGYRPTTAPVNATDVPLEYQPANESVYLGATAHVPVTITQVTPEMRLTDAPAEVTANDRTTVAGTVTVEETGAGAVPVAAYLGDLHLGTARTDQTGAFALTPTVPIETAAGTQPLRVAVVQDGRALAATTTTVDVTVTETPTEVTITAATEDDYLVNVSGQVSTAAGDAVGGQPVHLQVNGTTVQTLRTDANGRYGGTVDLSDSMRAVDAESEVTLAAKYRGQDIALAEARATTTVSLNRGGDETGSALGRALTRIESVPPVTVLFGGLGTVGLGFLLRYRLRDGAATADEPTTGNSTQTTRIPTTERASHTNRTDAATVATDHLSQGYPDRAVAIVYAATRHRLDAALGLDPGQTHWEVYTACRDASLSEERQKAVREIIAAFERATFTAADTPTSVAETAIDALERFDDHGTDAT